LNRLTSADYGEKSGANWTDDTKYNVYNLTYDKNGNIKTLNRDGDNDQIDSLSFQYYIGNQLQFVIDTASGTSSFGFYDGNNGNDDFAYDYNGNLIQDKNKGIDFIQYNELNLPEQVILGYDTVFFVYDAIGNKLMKMVSDSGTISEKVSYVNDIVYNKNDSISYLLTSEGRIKQQGGNFIYEYTSVR